jgi:hypothetical protein
MLHYREAMRTRLTNRPLSVGHRAFVTVEMQHTLYMSCLGRTTDARQVMARHAGLQPTTQLEDEKGTRGRVAPSFPFPEPPSVLLCTRRLARPGQHSSGTGCTRPSVLTPSPTE